MKQSSLDEQLAIEFEQADEEMREFDERQTMEDTGDIPQPPSPHPTTPIPAKGNVYTSYFIQLLKAVNIQFCYNSIQLFYLIFF